MRCQAGAVGWFIEKIQISQNPTSMTLSGRYLPQEGAIFCTQQRSIPHRTPASTPSARASILLSPGASTSPSIEKINVFVVWQTFLAHAVLIQNSWLCKCFQSSLSSFGLATCLFCALQARPSKEE